MLHLNIFLPIVFTLLLQLRVTFTVMQTYRTHVPGVVHNGRGCELCSLREEFEKKQKIAKIYNNKKNRL